jgi:hypothetical protein
MVANNTMDTMEAIDGNRHLLPKQHLPVAMSMRLVAPPSVSASVLGSSKADVR